MRRRHLRFGHRQILLARLRLELLQQRCCRLRLRLQLFRRRSLHRIVDQHQDVAFAHRLTFADDDLLYRARNFGINVGICTAGLVTLDDAFSINALRVGVRSRVEDRRLRRLLPAEDITCHAARQNADERQCEE